MKIFYSLILFLTSFNIYCMQESPHFLTIEEIAQRALYLAENNFFLDSNKQPKSLIAKNINRTKKFPCTICGIYSLWKKSIISHIKSHEEPNRVHICSFKHCHASFFSTQNKRQHERIHKNYRLFSCIICHRAFTRNSSLTIHKAIHFKREFVCDIKNCNALFSVEKDLKRHKKIPHNLKKKCPKCSQKFSSRGALMQHSRYNHKN